MQNFLRWCLCLISLCALSAFGQDKATLPAKLGWWLGTDLFGISLMPATNAITLDKGTFFRTELQVGYHSDNNLFFYLGLGRDLRKGEPVYVNVLDFRQESTYIKLMGGYRSRNAGVKRHIALGGFLGSTSQTGIISIGGGYFDPYRQAMKNSYAEGGVLFESGLEFPIAERLGLSISLLQTIGNHTDDTEYAVIYVAGAGQNAFPTGIGLWSYSFRCNLTYSLARG